MTMHSREELLMPLVLFVLVLTSVDAVKIKHLKLPNAMLNGTAGKVTLDCDYTFDSKDASSLVVKWYLNNSPQPVYQWIPPQLPQALGVLTRRVDLNYRASDDNHTMYRALRIIHPTTELSGEYRCHVSSFESEDDKRGWFIIYVPVRYVSIRHTIPNDDSVNITCTAFGLFPKPTSEMFIFKGRKQHRVKVSEANMVLHYVNGSYDATIYKIFHDRNLQAETVFECVFAIPESGYSIEQKYTYYPGSPNQPNHTNNVKSLVFSTEPSLIGVPTVTDSGSENRNIRVMTVLSSLLSLLMTASMLYIHAN